MLSQAKELGIELDLFLGTRKEDLKRGVKLMYGNEGGKKGSSRTRTIRKTRKRNFRGRRRTNRRHRRNVKK
jgi:hypothetical protein